MLVLSRRIGESIIINSNIKITFLDHKDRTRNVIRLGIEAPQEVPIYREEVWELIQKEKEPNND